MAGNGATLETHAANGACLRHQDELREKNLLHFHPYKISAVQKSLTQIVKQFSYL
jgi:alpha-glucuronidase